MFENQNEMVENKDFTHDMTYVKEERIPGVRGECAADFTLPDYMGDVKRLLKFSASASPCNKFVGTDEVSFLGIVTYRVLYLDSEDTLTEACFTSEYEHAERHGVGFVDADIETKIQNLTVRLQGPRKISAKASLSHDIFVTEEKTLSCEGVGADTEKKCKTVRIHAAKYVNGTERECAEEIGRLEGVSSDEVEIVKYEACANTVSSHILDSGIELRFEVIMWAIVRIGDEILKLEKKLPVEDVLTYDGVIPENATCKGRVYVTGATVNLNNDTSEENSGVGCYASVVMSVTTECSAAVNYNEECTVICDAFARGCINENTYSTFAYSEMLDSMYERKNFVSEIKRSDAGVGKLHDIIESEAQVKGAKWEICDDGVRVDSEVVFTVIARDDEGGYVSFKCPCEYKDIAKVATVKDKTKLQGTLLVFNPIVTYDTEKIYLSCEICKCLMTEKMCEERVLVSVKSTPQESEAQRCVVVYYPEDGDTLWSVAKKYSVTPAEIIKYNSLGDIYSLEREEEYPLDGVGKILIMKN